MPIAIPFTPPPPDLSQIHRLESLLEYGSRCYPNRHALSYFAEGQWHHISYLDLWARVCCAATALSSYVPRGSDLPTIALFLPNGPSQIVATLAALVAGAVFVPVDPEVAPSRFRDIAALSGCTAVVTDSTQKGRLVSLLKDCTLEHLSVVDLDTIAWGHTTRTSSNTPTKSAYVLFSSGTTGTPKGIVVSHAAVLSYCEASNRVFRANSNDRWLRAASYTFDVSIEELFVPLSVGAEVVIQPAGALESLSSYFRFLEDSSVTIASLPTALWHQMVKHVAQNEDRVPPALQLLVVGGEAGMTDALVSWRKHVGFHPRIVNAYGPTETTISATLWEATDFNSKSVMPIGGPLSNSKAYILDKDNLSPVKSGQEGVLYVSGPGLATEYLGNTELTRSKFVSNPFCNEPGYERMYNTGDLVVQDNSGVLHFIGRVDLQVQVRGFRVELEAIEASLSRHPSISSVAVISVEQQQTTSLHAFIVQSTGTPPLHVEDLIHHCQQSLAHYEIPARFFKIDSIPFNQSGKIDRRALASLRKHEYGSRKALTVDDGDAAEYGDLAELWCECLEGVSSSDLHAYSHFLHLGGHSLTLITLSSKIKSAFGVSVTAVELLRHPELGAMSSLIASKPLDASQSSDEPEDQSDDTLIGSYPLTLPQERLFSVQQNSPDSPFFNDGLAIRLSGKLHENRLMDAIKQILVRHSILRAKLVHLENGQVGQTILPADDDFFSRVFIREISDRQGVEQRAYQIFSQQFDLFEGPLLKVALLSSDSEDHILVVCAHHIVWDGYSDNVFLEEFVKLYRGEKLLRAPRYLDTCSDTTTVDPVRLETLKSYLDNVTQTIDLPNDFVRPETQSYSRGRSLYFDLGSDAMPKILKRLGGSPASATLAVFATALHLAAARQQDFMVGVPFANRASPEAARAIGFFVNMLPVRMRFSDTTSLDDVYDLVRKDLLFLSELEDVPFDALVNSLKMNRFSSRESLIQASFAFQDAPEGSLSSNTTFTHFPLSNGAARTDLTLFVEVGKTGRLAGELEYNTDIFEHSTMESMSQAISQILNAWANNGSMEISSIPFIVPKLSSLSPPDTRGQSLGAYLATLGERFADRLAVYDDNTGQQYTYSQLFSKAQRIQELVKPLKRQGHPIILLVDRSADVLAAEIGASLAGLAWIPCDVSQPKSRILDIATDAKPSCALASRDVLNRLALNERDFGAPVLAIPPEFDSRKSIGELVVDEADELAYIIYTSGTTGKPKGVTIGHESIIAFLQHVASWSEHDTPFHSILTSNVAFDGSMSQMYAALVTGGSVKMPKIGGEQDGEYLSRLMNQTPAVNYLCTTSAAVRMWLDQTDTAGSFFPPNFQHILLGGDALTPAFAQRVFAATSESPQVQLKNVYGPTEGTIFSSYGVLTHADLDRVSNRCRVPIDRLMPHVEMTVASPKGNSLPRGFVGEIIIWGPCLTPGYSNLPQVNAAKFLTKDGMRGWRSGDLGRQLPCGRFEILGQTDSMCKVRGGFRVELAEIQTHIAGFDQVVDCHVSVDTLGGADRQIVAHVVFQPDSNQDAQTVADWKQMFEGVNEEIQTFEEDVDLGFDYRGWTSSFDRKHISADDMAEWIDTTVDRILSLDCFKQGRKPRILEIGSGTGMILFRVAPHAEKYVGLDLTEAVVHQVRQHSQKLKYDHVEVHVSPAHLFDQVLTQDEWFDLVICNSVAQYFPSFQYLQSLVDRTANYLEPGGYLYFGDLRNFSLTRQFATAIALADRPQSISSLANAISRSINIEEELLVSPDYFTLLARDDIRFESAVTYLRRGFAHTEMNLFRFDAVLRSVHKPKRSIPEISLQERRWSTLDSLDAILSSHSLPLLLRDVPNARIADAHHVSISPLDGSQTLSEVLDAARAHQELNAQCNPEKMLQQITQRGQYVALPICSLDRPECFDILVASSKMSLAEVERLGFHSQVIGVENSPETLSFSNKQKVEVSRETLRLLHEHMSRRVPAYMVPDYVVPVDRIPLNGSHKVNVHKLPQPTTAHRFVIERQTRDEWSAADIARRPIVEAILKVFSTVLFTDKTLSPYDDFFASGGHSLIATKATSMIRRELDVQLPFTAIIMAPTASELAVRVESIKAESDKLSQLPPNVTLLRPAASNTPRAALFVFHPIGGGLAPFTPLVKQLGAALSDLTIYGVVWEPERNLSSMDSLITAYTSSISAVKLPASMTRYLLGWSFGGLVASEVAGRLQDMQCRLLLLDAPTTTAIRGTVQESFFPQDLAEHMREVLNLPPSNSESEKLAETIRASNIHRQDVPQLSSLVSKHLPVPAGVTEAQIGHFIQALSNNFEVLVGLGNAEPKLAEDESKVILNMQAARGLCVRDGLSEGLGWSRFERVDCDHDEIISLPIVATKILEALQDRR